MNNRNIIDMNPYGFSGNFGTSINALKNQQDFSDNTDNVQSVSQNSESFMIQNLNPNISKLVSDVNKSLEDFAPSISKSESEESEEQIDNSNGLLSTIPNWIKEIILFVVIYFIFSMGFVKNYVGTYIKYINPDSEGNISFIGIIIYGTILISIFLIFKYFLAI